MNSDGVDKEIKFVKIEYSNLTWTVNVGKDKGEKKILDGISGHFLPGSLIGILGPSGAGKTTLLNILSGLQNQKVKGNIYINGEERNLEKFKKISCYITQDNDLQGLLTVDENMKYAADLKLGSNVSQDVKDEIIYDILQTFGLLEIRQVLTKNISGGQMKRLSVALELINNPNVLFLDEPTTGLDSSSCFQCMEYLKRLADEGRTIICTIHQPLASIFKLFSQVYILAKGKCLYSGDSNQVVTFMEKIGVPCPTYHNPADYVIEVASGDYGEYNIDKMIKLSQNGLNTSFMSVPQIKDREIEDIKYESQLGNRNINRNINVVLYELKTLIQRDYTKMKRDPFRTHLRLIASVTNSIAVSCVFWKIGSNGSNPIYNYNMICCFIVNLIVGGLMTTVLAIPTELSILRKESFNGYYSLLNYLLTITIIDIPISLIYGIVSNVLVYYLTEQPLELHRVAKFTATGFLITIVGQSLGLFLGAYFNLQNGTFIASYIHFPLMLFSGFCLLMCDIPKYLTWVSYLSYLRYGVEGMVGAIYGYNRSKLPCKDADFCLYSYGEDFLVDVGVEGNRFWIDVGALLFIYLLLRVLCYLAMRYRLSQHI